MTELTCGLSLLTFSGAGDVVMLLRALAVLMVVVILAGYTLTTTAGMKPAHFAIWGPSARIEAYASKVRTQEPALGVKVSFVDKGVSRVDMDLVRGSSISDYPALAGGAGLKMSYTTPSPTFTVKVSNLFGIVWPGAKP